MIQTKFVYLLVIILASASAFEIVLDEDSELSGVRDARSNVTDAEFTQVKKIIQDAEATYTGNDNILIARYIAQAAKNLTDNGTKWNVYVYTGPIQRLAVGAGLSIRYNKYLWFINYGRYNFTYIMIAQFGALCQQANEIGGGAGTAQFGQDINSTDQQKILAIIDNSIIYKGDDIIDAASYIFDRVRQGLAGTWTTIIAEPTTKYGYYVCRTTAEKWFAFRSYKDFKWNYLATELLP